MKPIAGILLFLLSSWSAGAWAAECRCEYPDKATLEAAARADEKVQAFLAGATPKKVIVAPGRLVNIVA